MVGVYDNFWPNSLDLRHPQVIFSSRHFYGYLRGFNTILSLSAPEEVYV